MIKIFQIKYGCVENYIRNNFPCWNFQKIWIEFELQIKEALGFEIHWNLMEIAWNFQELVKFKQELLTVL
jgi:hypothetical protein